MPWGMKPVPPVKFAAWNDRKPMTTTVSSGMANFQITMMPLLSERNFAPTRFIAVKMIIRMVATSRPLPVSAPFSLIMLKLSFTDLRLFT